MYFVIQKCGTTDNSWAIFKVGSTKPTMKGLSENDAKFHQENLNKIEDDIKESKPEEPDKTLTLAINGYIADKEHK